MDIEKKSGSGPDEDRPGLRWTFFEDWLAEQEDRQDATGEVARFVRADIERGCWEASHTFDQYMMRPEVERRGMARHVIFHHNMHGKAVIAFERAHKEYEQARDENFDRVRKWYEDRGEYPFGPIF